MRNLLLSSLLLLTSSYSMANSAQELIRSNVEREYIQMASMVVEKNNPDKVELVDGRVLVTFNMKDMHMKMHMKTSYQEFRREIALKPVQILFPKVGDVDQPCKRSTYKNCFSESYEAAQKKYGVVLMQSQDSGFIEYAVAAVKLRQLFYYTITAFPSVILTDKGDFDFTVRACSLGECWYHWGITHELVKKTVFERETVHP